MREKEEEGVGKCTRHLRKEGGQREATYMAKSKQTRSNVRMLSTNVYINQYMKQCPSPPKKEKRKKNNQERAALPLRLHGNNVKLHVQAHHRIIS